MTRTLTLMRHARAEAGSGQDIERMLTAEGRADARASGEQLAGLGIVPDAGLVSAARRTVETWRCAAEAAGWAVEVTPDEGMYSAGSDTVLDLVRGLTDDHESALVVGHNPTIAYLAQLLDDGEGDPDASSTLLRGFPPASFAVFTLTGPWCDLAPGRARLADFWVGSPAGG